MILVEQLAEPSIPRPPFPARRRGGGHMTEALEFRQRPCPTGSEIGGRALRQAPCRPDEMRQARLALRHPGLVDPVAITDEEPGPILDEGGKGGFGAVGVDHIERHGLIRHDPQPVQRVREQPRGFINVIDRARRAWLAMAR